MRCVLLCTCVLLSACGGQEQSPAGPGPGSPRLEVQSSTMSIGAGASAQVEVTAWNGTVQVHDPRITWASSAPTLVTVSEDGQVTGVAPGTATVSALWQGATASVTVMVLPYRLELLEMPATTTMVPGAAYLLTAGYTNVVYGFPPGAANFAWHSDDESVAKIVPVAGSAAAVLTATGPGLAHVTTTGGGLETGVTVSVLSPLTAGMGDLSTSSPGMVEYSPSTSGTWQYAPVFSVTAAAYPLDVMELQVTLPGSHSVAARWCGSLRLQPGQTRDLNPAVWPDYPLWVAGSSGWRAPAGAAASATLTYRGGGPTTVSVQLVLPVLIGEPPDQDDTLPRIWFPCPPS